MITLITVRNHHSIEFCYVFRLVACGLWLVDCEDARNGRRHLPATQDV